jgi:hypothetical protein
MAFAQRRGRRAAAAAAAAVTAATLLVLLVAGASAATAPAKAVAAKKQPLVAAAVAAAISTPAAAAAPAPPTKKKTAAGPVGSGERAVAAQARLGDDIPDDPAVAAKVEREEWRSVSWDKFMEAFPRFTKQIRPALARGQVLGAQPIPAEPTDPIVGDCVPFKVPAPYTSLQQYIQAFRTMPWQDAERMFKQAHTYRGGIGIRGCAAGAIIGNNLWARLGYITPLSDSWSGKCIDEDKETEVPYALTNAIAPFQLNKRNWRAQRVPGDKMGTATVELGKSWLDGQPAWVFDYSKSEELYGFDFRDIRDEVRVVAPGHAIGAVYARGSNATHVSAFNPGSSSMHLIFFALFQTCASDGNYPTQPIDRVYP